MNAPTLRSFWQGFAGLAVGVPVAIAMAAFDRHCFLVCRSLSSLGAHTTGTSLTPSPRSGLSLAGPTPLPFTADRRAVAVCVKWFKNRFEFRDISVESGAITTNQRGSYTCASRFSSSLFFPLRWLAACRILHRAGSPVPPRGRLSPTRWMKTSSRVPLWAALPVPQPAGSKWVCRPATRATDLAAFGRTTESIKDHPGRPPGWSFAF